MASPHRPPPPADLWSTLPTDLLAAISTRLIPAVCRSWRSSSVPPPSLTAFLASFKLPFPEMPAANRAASESATSPPSSSSTGTQISQPCDCVDSNSCSMCVGLLDHRVYELATWQAVKFEGYGKKKLLEMAVVPSVKDVRDVKEGDRVRLIGIYKGRLVHMRLGDKKWEVLEVRNVEEVVEFSDIMYREGDGKFYAVDDVGNLAIIDSGMNVDVVARPLPDAFPDKLERKFVVESNGQVYQVVDWEHCESGVC